MTAVPFFFSNTTHRWLCKALAISLFFGMTPVFAAERHLLTVDRSNPEHEMLDGPPLKERDINQIKNPIPKPEPLSVYGNPFDYEVLGKRYTVLSTSAGYQQRGYASWYGTKFHGKPTSTREPYDMFAMTAASKVLPIPCYVRVTNLENGRQVVVKVNDRGPFHDDRIIDLSYAAAKKLALLGNGTALVHVEALPPHQTVAPHQRSRKFKSTPETKNTAENTAKSNQQYYLQIGAFDRSSNAHDLAKAIRQIVKNKSVNVAQVSFKEGSFYRVKVGPLTNENEGSLINQRLNAAGLTRGILVAMNQ